jgi:N-acetylglucosamine-6-phosphate deacetylase
MTEPLNIKGFIDLQVNGFKGIDFSSAELTEDSFVFACRELRKKGTIGFLPTLISSTVEVYQKNLRIISSIKKYGDFNNLILGIHLEGPFISAENGYRGVHPLENIRDPDIGFLKQLISWSNNNIRLMTIAAEKPDAAKLCSYAVKHNIIISLGHQQADEKQINKCVERGAKAMTHLGNGLPHFINRHDNPIWTGLGNDLIVMIITDGFHLPISVIKTIIKVKGIKNTIMVSDLSPLGGLKPGNYKIWNTEVALSRNGFLYDPSSGYLAASSSTLLDAANYLLSQEIADLNDIYRMAFYNPLRLLGIDPVSYKKTKSFILKNKKISIG